MNERLRIFDNLHEIVYISDVETYEIIYMNKAARRFFSARISDDSVGRRCYELFQGRKTPCPFCSTPRLECNSFFEWEHHNKLINKTFRLRDTLFMFGGRKYRMEIGTDILDITAENGHLLQNYQTHEAIINEGLRIALTPENPDEGLQDFIAFVGKTSGAERVYIFENAGDVANNTYEWCADGITPEKANLQNVPPAVLNIWYKTFEKNDYIIIRDIEEIRENDSAMYHTLKPQNIKSLIVCKFMVDGKMSGFCGFDNPPLSSLEACTGFLSIFSQYLGVLLAKRDYIREKSYNAIFDPLTGLFNRSFFFKKVNQLMKENPDQPKWMVLINIKDFKLINNLFGTEFGDQILTTQGNIIRQFVKPDIICGRIYGDKFVLLIPRTDYNKSKFESALAVLSEKMTSFNYTLCHHVVACNVTGATLSAESLYNCLNIAAKSIQSKHDFTCIECKYNSIEEKYITDTKILSQFTSALAKGQFKMYLQAHLDKDENIMGGEALVRWEHPTKGLIYPGDFLPLIEKSGLIHKLDYAMWRMAAAKISEWKSTGHDQWHISVNVSAVDFYNLDVYDTFVALVEEFQIKPQNFILEITESAVIENFSTISTVMKKLKSYGFIIAMDDFGKGYSSLNTIVELPFDIIKFDKAFLDKPARENEESQLVLKTLIELVRKLKAVSIFEGVETKAQFDMLHDIGADFFQGYYFSEPISESEFDEKYC